jgi:simple sugar transport system ATP-binding protein
VAENLFLATQPRSRLGLISWRETRTQARRLLDEWGLDIQETAEVSRLKLSERQLVEAARELARGARVVILDEPTSRLSRVEILRLYAHIKELQQRGVTMLYISHHLEEVLELCHTVTVLRDGRHVATRQVAETNQAELVEDMVGEVRLPHAPSEDGSQEDRDPVLEVEGLSAPGLASCSFVARGGELLGVAGLVGSGKEVVADLLSGNVVASGGVVRVDGRSLRLGSIATAMKAGIAYVPADRARDGLVASMTVAENVTMSIDRRIADSMGMIWPERRKRAARELMAATEMVAASPDLAVSALSGGNQQKVVIARALALRPRVLVLANPTTGVDVASKAVIYSVIDRYRREGMAILMISDELEEYLLCDRVLVLFKGAISKEFTSTPNPAMLLAAVEGID